MNHRRRPTVRQWNPMGNLMSRAVSRHGLGTQLTASAVCQAANSLSQGRWQAISFRERRLKIAVADYDMAAVLRIQEKKIIADINAAVGADAILTLQYTIRPLQTRTDVVT